MPKYYLLDENKNLVEGFDKEGFLALLEQAIEQGTLENIDEDSAVASKLRSVTNGTTHHIEFVTQAQFNQLEADDQLVADTYYFITDDTTEEDLEQALNSLSEDVGSLEARLDKKDEYQLGYNFTTLEEALIRANAVRGQHPITTAHFKLAGTNYWNFVRMEYLYQVPMEVEEPVGAYGYYFGFTIFKEEPTTIENQEWARGVALYNEYDGNFKIDYIKKDNKYQWRSKTLLYGRNVSNIIQDFDKTKNYLFVVKYSSASNSECFINFGIVPSVSPIALPLSDANYSSMLLTGIDYQGTISADIMKNHWLRINLNYSVENPNWVSVQHFIEDGDDEREYTLYYKEID